MPNFSKKKKRLVIDGDAIYWEVDGKRLSDEEAKKLQEQIDMNISKIQMMINSSLIPTN